MKVPVLMLAFMDGRVRLVDVPDEVEGDDRRILDAAFHYGQNDVQPQEGVCSVSVGDVVTIEDRIYRVASAGFQRMTREQLEAYKALDRRDRHFWEPSASAPEAPPVALTERERVLLGLVAKAGEWTSDHVVTRQSDREFDLHVAGRHVVHPPRKVGRAFAVPFEAWLPLAAIRALVPWNTPAVARMTDHPGMAMDGDWSAVRDSSHEAIWEIVDDHVLPLVYRAPASPAGRP